MSVIIPMPEVLTLEEVAQYLRLPPEVVERQVLKGTLPGRRIEDTWRFLKSAIDDWLRRPDGRTLLLQQAGALADDRVEEFLEHIYAQRDQAASESDR